MLNLLSLVPLASTLIERLIPDKDMAAKAKAKLAEMEQQGELALLLKQLEINAEEAKHTSLFVAGWRPFLGWVCGIAFAYHFVLLPIITLILAASGIPATLPAFDMGTLTTVLFGMLGLGGLRTFEKYKGVNRDKLD